MGEISHENLWDYHIIAAKYPCLCCKRNIMIRDDHKTWRRGHVVHVKHGGHYTYENVRPICLDCNKNDQSFTDSYAYMVYLGTMTEEERSQGLWRIANPDQRNSRTIKCIIQGCVHNRKPHMNTCGVHGTSVREYMKRSIAESYVIHKKMYDFLLRIGETEEAEEVRKMMNETVMLFREIK